MKHWAIYAGTFDPLTLGHTDLIERAAHIFERLILAVAVKSRKETMFTVDERLAMAQEVLKGSDNVVAESFDGLLVDYAREKGVSVLIRGLRAYADFEYEFQMALTNRKMAPDVETLFLMPQEDYSYVSSSTVREIIERGGDASQFVPAAVKGYIERYIEKHNLRNGR